MVVTRIHLDYRGILLIPVHTHKASPLPLGTAGLGSGFSSKPLSSLYSAMNLLGRCKLTRLGIERCLKMMYRYIMQTIKLLTVASSFTFGKTRYSHIKLLFLPVLSYSKAWNPQANCYQFSHTGTFLMFNIKVITSHPILRFNKILIFN